MARRALQRYAARGAAHGVVAAKVSLSARGSDDRAIEATITLEACDLGRGGALVFDATRSLDLAGVEADRGDWFISSRRKVVVLQPRSHGEWNGAKIRFRLQQPPNDVSPVVVFPQQLPAMLPPQSAGQVTQIETGDVDDAHVMGISADPQPEVPTFYQCAIAFTGRGPRHPLQEVSQGTWYSGRLLSQLNAVGSSLTAERVDQMRAFLAALFGAGGAWSTILLASDEIASAPWIETGLVVAVDPAEYVTASRDWLSGERKIVSRLASAWWGTACRIAGRRAAELEAAIGAAASLRWCEVNEGSWRAARILSFYERLARRGRLSDLRDEAWGRMPRGVFGSLVIELANAMRQPGSLRWLQSVIREHWACYVQSADFLQGLRES